VRAFCLCHPFIATARQTAVCLQPKYLLPRCSLTLRLRCVMLGSCLLSVWIRQGLARTSIKFDDVLHIQGRGLCLSGTLCDSLCARRRRKVSQNYVPLQKRGPMRPSRNEQLFGAAHAAATPAHNDATEAVSRPSSIHNRSLQSAAHSELMPRSNARQPAATDAPVARVRGPLADKPEACVPGVQLRSMLAVQSAILLGSHGLSALCVSCRS
jgi:hypothetical protein